MEKKYNGFNNGRDRSAGVGGQPATIEPKQQPDSVSWSKSGQVLGFDRGANLGVTIITADRRTVTFQLDAQEEVQLASFLCKDNHFIKMYKNLFDALSVRDQENKVLRENLYKVMSDANNAIDGGNQAVMQLKATLVKASTVVEKLKIETE